MQALNAAISSSCGLGALSPPSSSHGSSATILCVRAIRSPAMVKPSTIVSLRVCPAQRVVTSKPTIACLGSCSMPSTTSPRAVRSRPLTRLFTVSSIFISPVVGLNSGEQRRRFRDPLGGSRRDRFERRLEALVDHAGADIGPAPGLVLLRPDGVTIVELAPDRRLERVEVETGLRPEAIVEESADLEE